jgi:hypothetical protein
LIFSHCKRTGSIRNFKRGAADKAGLHGPNVGVERQLLAGCARQHKAPPGAAS